MNFQILFFFKKVVVELGAYYGYSAVRLGRLLPAESKLISIDFSPYYAVRR
jgi:predicted O-methyltransferase YrrM